MWQDNMSPIKSSALDLATWAQAKLLDPYHGADIRLMTGPGNPVFRKHEGAHAAHANKKKRPFERAEGDDGWKATKKPRREENERKEKEKKPATKVTCFYCGKAGHYKGALTRMDSRVTPVCRDNVKFFPMCISFLKHNAVQT